ncbi:MAG TPA: alpha-L-fucosidase [Candidatus Elarobacter sp.]|nr:alpha-L-fucosidase [Candidatus Elarobacter sp.]
MGRLDAFDQAKFGIMITWGIYTVGAVEASWPLIAPWMWSNSPSDETYFGWAAQFDPANFDARTWVQTFASAGARYLVPVTKHHDGFCMFDAPGVDFKSTNPAYANRDFMAELATACTELDFPNLGWYYSPPDLHNANYRNTTRPAADNWWSDYVTDLREPDPAFANYLATMKEHLRTLLTDPRYRVGDNPVFSLWFDGLTRQWIFDPYDVHEMVAQLSPQTLTDNRLLLTGDFITPENFVPDAVPVNNEFPPLRPLIGDAMFFGLELPALRATTSWQGFYKNFIRLQNIQTPTSPPWPIPPAVFQPWESCMTMSASESWSYNPNDTYRPVSELIQGLAHAASFGGNFLLNVGPAPDGTIPDGAGATLAAIGAWLNVNGAAIYGTSYGPFSDGSRTLYTTSAGGTVYLHAFDPSRAVCDGSITLQSFTPSVSAVNALSGGTGPLPFTQSGGTLSIDVSSVTFDPNDTVFALTVG